MRAFRFVFVALALAVAVPAMAGDPAPSLSWEDAGHLPPPPAVLPRPTEPDAPNNGPLRVDPAPPAPPQPPPVYRLADASGQAWEHADPAYLRAFVADRNSRMVPAAVFYRGSACSSGSCPR